MIKRCEHRSIRTFCVFYRGSDLTAALCVTYLSAGYFCARVAGRLRAEIVRPAVDDDRSPDNIAHFKTIRQKRGECAPMVPEKRREVPRVAGMRAIARVIMPHCAREGVLAIRLLTRGTLVYMEAENTPRARARTKRQTSQIRHDQHALGGLVKINFSF